MPHTLSKGFGSMTHINSLFPSNYVAAIDLQGQLVDVQILSLKFEKVGSDQEERPVLYFAGMTKGMVMNKTNARRIAKLYGPDIEGWFGRWITLYESETDFGGETVPCIRVKERIPSPGLAGSSVAVNGNHTASEVAAAPAPVPPPIVQQQPAAGVAGAPTFPGAMSGGPRF